MYKLTPLIPSIHRSNDESNSLHESTQNQTEPQKNSDGERERTCPYALHLWCCSAPRGSFLVLHLVGGRRKEKVNGKGKRQPIYHITTQLVHQTDRCGPDFTITRESIRDADLRTDGPEHRLMDKQNINRLTWSKSDIENISSVN